MRGVSEYCMRESKKIIKNAKCAMEVLALGIKSWLLVVENRKPHAPIETCGEYVEINLGYPRKANKTPAATAEPITPATFGPMACMRR